ncbi:MAG: nucleotidyltransferase family protein [Clostridia bacterium]|nr:nucleotidyltransferase family protein [Clostridia bacterium]
MKTVAVICEYNPFHLGHAYHFAEIRKAYGEDTAIVAIMGGNFSQRGEPMLFGKNIRAQMAVEAGANLVLELPFPYAASGAEFFASAAVYIAHSIGIIDILSFGSESGDLQELALCASRLSSREFSSALLDKAKEKGSSIGTAALQPLVYQEVYGESCGEMLSSPNNILALSYLKALYKLSSPITPHTVKRLGSYKEDESAPVGFASASYLRHLLTKGDIRAALSYIPTCNHTLLEEALKTGAYVSSFSLYGKLLLGHFRLHPTPRAEYAESGGGLYRHIAKNAAKASSYEEWISASTTKKYPSARIRRAALFSFFEVTPQNLREEPAYTQVLAMDACGQALLRQMRKKSALTVINKPASFKNYSATVAQAASLSHRADSVYALLRDSGGSADCFIRTSPYCK